MNLVVFGATGKTGKQVVKQALHQGHAVTAFVRDPDRLGLEDENLSIIVGDIFEYDIVNHAVQGQDAVVCAVGSNELGKTTVRSDGTMNIIKAMQQEQVCRLVVVTAMGIGESWNSLSFFNKLIFNTLLRSTRNDHEIQEKVVKESNLDWTIIRPSGLTETPLTGEYLFGENITAKTSRIACADVAHAILLSLQDEFLVKKALTITN